LLGRTLHALDELERPYVVLIEGVPTMFKNCSPLHAAAIVEAQYLLNAKIQEYKIEAEAEKQTAIPDGDGGVKER
jgi:hypothetical protein